MSCVRYFKYIQTASSTHKLKCTWCYSSIWLRKADHGSILSHHIKAHHIKSLADVDLDHQAKAVFVSFLPGKLILLPLPLVHLLERRHCVQHRFKDLYSSSTEIIAVSFLQRFFYPLLLFSLSVILPSAWTNWPFLCFKLKCSPPSFCHWLFCS